MNNKSENHANIMFRYVLITFGILLFSGLIAGNLFSTTIVHADDWNNKANTELQKTDTIYPVRGDILAADGSLLVTNLVYYTLRVDYRAEGFMESEYLAAIPALSDSLAKHFPSRDKDGWADYLRKPMAKKAGERPRAFTLLQGLDNNQVGLVKTFPFFNIDNSNKTGLTKEEHNRRDCPYGDMARRSIGKVGQTAECKEIHGISGLEKALDSLLYGTPGIYKRVPFTKRIGNWTDIPAVDGYTVKTTIDITLQDILESELNTMLDSTQAEWGTAILMEVATGDIKAISNLERSSSGKYVEAYNRAVVAYEPGSVVKPISMMLALEDGLVSDLDEVIPIGASYAYAGGRPITDSHFNASLTVAGVIEQSSNIGMTRIITKPTGPYHNDPAAFPRRLEGIGFLDKMNSGIFEEETPRMSRKPSRVDLSRMCYGYATAIPPIYTLSVYNAIANDGRYVRPRLVSGLRRDGVDSLIPVSVIRESICSPENAAKMRQMLSRVVAGERGTGRRLKNPNVAIAGKTGTCYHIDTVIHRYDHSRKRLAFCGFFPADKPRYSMFVLTFHPRRTARGYGLGAASTSGEVLKNVALKMYSRGLLGDNPDFADEKPAKPAMPTINATVDNKVPEELVRQIVASGRPLVFSNKLGEVDEHNVPKVTNLGLREALTRLEQAGFNVKFTGYGRVVRQALGEGNTVYLTLSNRC